MTSRASGSLAARVRAIVADHRGERGALLPILRDMQDTFGYIAPGAVPVLADELNLSRAEVHGMISFYRDFRTTPPGRIRVRVCRGVACQAVGAEPLAAHVREWTGLGFGETAPHGGVTLDDVLCLGNCALGPSVQINGRLYGRVDADRMTALIAGAAR